MTIGIDISQLAYPGSGVARYTENLVKAVLTHDAKNSYIFFYSSLRIPLKSEIKALIEKKAVLRRYFIPPTILSFLWNTLHIAPIEWFIGEIDLFISSDWCQPPRKKAKMATVIHDLVVYKYPETATQKTTFDMRSLAPRPNIVANQKKRLQWVKAECDIVIADSHATKQDIIEILGISSNKIHVIYPAVEIDKPTKEQVEKVLAKYHILNSKYYLTVGKLEPRKNIPRLISAFQKANLKNVTLVIVGPKGWDDRFCTTPDSPGVAELTPPGWRNQEKIKFLGYVSDTDLYALYTGARLFIMPSLYEGFGYPVMEAMILGCPVAASNTSSLKELVEDKGILFDPENEKEIIKVLQGKQYSKPTFSEGIFSLKNFYYKFIKVLKP